MKRTIVVLATLFLSFRPFAGNAQKRAKHVIVVGFDGFGAYALPKADMPNLKNLIETGAHTTQARSVLPSSSAVNWASMLMGASPSIHGYTEWGSKTPEIPSSTVTENNIFPSIFTVIKAHNPKAKLAAVYSWDGIGYLLEKPIIDINIPTKGDEEQTAIQSAEVIKKEKPTFMFIHFDQPDGAGHEHGHDSPGYYEELKLVDKRLGSIQRAIKDAGIEKETLLIVLADHGGIEKGHGGKTMMEIESPWIMVGPGVRAGHKVTEPIVIYDFAATIAWYLGVKPNEAWRGKAIKGFFQ